MSRSSYSNSVIGFLNDDKENIRNILVNKTPNATGQQKNAWDETIEFLQNQLAGIQDGRIMLEYTIPRMGRRVDAVLLHNNIVFVMEFKCGDTEYARHTIDQVYGYVQDLKNFQKESENKLLVPIIIPTKAQP